MDCPKTQYYSESRHPFHADFYMTVEPFNMQNYHYHNSYEILYFNEGERKFFFRDRIYHIEEGNLILINKYELHSIGDWKKAGHSRTFISFTENFFDRINTNGIDLFSCYHRGIVVIEPTIRHQQEIYHKTSDILTEFENKRKGYEISLQAKMIDLLIYFDRILDNYHDKTDVLSPKYKIINEIMVYIKDHYNEKLTLESISQEAGYSKNYLSTAFKNTSGFSINQYINAIRIKEAQKLLKKTSLSVTQISGMTGFDSITHFGRVFKFITGYTPLKYRKDKTLMI